MNRRDFLVFGAAAVAASRLPQVEASEPATAVDLATTPDRTVIGCSNEDYWVFLGFVDCGLYAATRRTLEALLDVEIGYVEGVRFHPAFPTLEDELTRLPRELRRDRPAYRQLLRNRWER